MTAGEICDRLRWKVQVVKALQKTTRPTPRYTHDEVLLLEQKYDLHWTVEAAASLIEAMDLGISDPTATETRG